MEFYVQGVKKLWKKVMFKTPLSFSDVFITIGFIVVLVAIGIYAVRKNKEKR